VPTWLRREFVRYQVATPTMFDAPGEVEQYVDHVTRVLTDLRGRLLLSADSLTWRAVLEQVVDQLNLLQVLFVDRNTRPLFEMRATLAEHLLTLDGALLDHDFGDGGVDGSRLRVGFLVRDGSPRTESFITLPHVRHIDRARYQTFLYAVDWNEGLFQSHLRDRFDQFANLSGLTVCEAVEVVRRDRLDYLLLANVDYALINRFNRIAAHRLARVQMATTAITPTTTGSRYVDVMLSAPATEPEDDPQRHYRERLVLTDGSFNCFDFGPPRPEPPREAPKLLARIPEDAVVFTGSATFFKLIPELTHVWMDILARAENGYLVMFFQNPNWAPRYPTYFLVRRLVHECRERGVDPARLVILPPLTRGDIDAVMARTDIYLDSYPYSGAASLMDPLPAGVPVVAWRGRAQRGLQAAAMLRAIGLEDWIADTAEAYRDKALALANDHSLRAAVRAQIEERMPTAPFLDSQAYARRFMAVLEQLNPRARP
jgi:predicted O-linked N-acetylglucosamine transferase (SPINDLY family)